MNADPKDPSGHGQLAPYVDFTTPLKDTVRQWDDRFHWFANIINTEPRPGPSVHHEYEQHKRRGLFFL